MHKRWKGNQWYFAMKLYIGMDRKTMLVHSAVSTRGNEHDSQVLDDLLHGNEMRM